MNLERITQPIETENTEERELKLAERLMGIQVYFADSRYNKRPGENESRYSDFSDALNKNTPLITRILTRYSDSVRDDKDRNEKSKSFAVSLNNKINKIYRETADREKRDELITQYLFDTYSRIKKEEPNEIERRMDEDTTIGVIKIEPSAHEDTLMEQAGFNPEDEFLSIHFPSFYENGSERSLLVELDDSFKKLAEIIPREYPEAQAVIGKSWLLSLPAAERLGFKKVITLESHFNGNGLWSQFIDQNGNISKHRFEEFIKTGKPPYEVSLGYIPIEEFLSRYLPTEKKGEIILKEIDPKWNREDTQKLEEYTEKIHQLREDFENFVNDKSMSAEAFIQKYPAVVEVMTKAGCYGDLLKIMNEARDKGYRIEEIGRRMPLENSRLEKAYQEYRDGLKSKKYRDRKVFIK